MFGSAIGIGGGASRHPSVEALLNAHDPGGDPKLVIRRLARELVAKGKAAGWCGPPFCPKQLASFFDIRVKQVDHDIDGEGRILLHRDGKLRIEYRSGRMFERQRFTIAHEIAHTLFPDYCKFVPQYSNPRRKPKDPEKEFENLCDIGASEILFPFEEFQSDLRMATKLNLETVRGLGTRYEASVDATIMRLTDLSEYKIGVVFLTDQRGDFVGRGPLWVRYGCKTNSCGTFIPSGVTPPWNSVAIACFKQNIETTAEAKETWWINNRPYSWLVQATRLPLIAENRDYPKVVALLLPTGFRKRELNDKLGLHACN